MCIRKGGRKKRVEAREKKKKLEKRTIKHKFYKVKKCRTNSRTINVSQSNKRKKL